MILRVLKRLPVPAQLAIFLGCALPLLWSAIFFNLRHIHDDTIASARSESHNLARAFAEEVQSSVDAIDLTLIDLRDRWNGDRTAFAAAVLKRQRYLERDVAFQVAIIDSRGRLTFSSVDPNARPVDISDRDHFRVHRDTSADRLYVSKPLLGRVSKRWSIQFTRPLQDSAGHFDGVIVLSVAPEFFSRFYRTISLGPDSTIALVRSSGDILARSPHPELGLGRTLAGTAFQAPARPETGTERSVSQIDGIERQYTWRRLPKSDMVVVVGQSVDSLLAPYRKLRTSHLVAGIAMSLLITLIGCILLAGMRQRAIVTAQLVAREARWKLALEAAGDGVWDWNIAQHDVQFSRRGKEMLGHGDERIRNHIDEWSKRVHPDDLPRALAAFNAHLDGRTPSYSSEYRMRVRQDDQDDQDEWKWVLDRGLVVSRDGAGKPLRVVGTLSDITERKSREEAARHSAQHDPLTGLPNRALFADRLAQEIARARRDNSSIALLYLDLDRFKPVNDNFGHAAGDLLLEEVARRMRGCLRESDTLARLGGDEFVLLLPGIRSEENALAIAAKLHAALCAPFDLGSQRVHIGSCIGIAIYPQHGMDAAVLMQRADEAMYRAKECGRNNIQLWSCGQAPSQASASATGT